MRLRAIVRLCDERSSGGDFYTINNFFFKKEMIIGANLFP